MYSISVIIEGNIEWYCVSKYFVFVSVQLQFMSECTPIDHGNTVALIPSGMNIEYINYI